MDNFSLIVCTALISISMVTILLALFLLSRKERYLVDWIVAGTCFFLSNSIGLMLSLSNERLINLPVIANGFYMAGHVAVLSGISLLLLGKSLRNLIPVAFAATVGLHQFDIVIASVENRMIIFYPIIIAITIASIILLLLNHKNRDERRALYVLIFSLSFFAIQQALRVHLILNDEFEMIIVGNDFIQTSGTLFLMLHLFLLTISFSTIVVWRKEIELRKIALVDDLSGWLNRKSLEKRATEEVERSTREGKELCFIMVDIDHFKSINDRYGHAAGDAAIQHVCTLAGRVKREYDLKYRVGGEEFLIIAPHTSKEQAKLVSERIRLTVAKTPLRFEGQHIWLTVSIGIASSIDKQESWKSMYELADNALYLSKEKGRNIVS